MPEANASRQKVNRSGPVRVLLADEAAGTRLNLSVALRAFDPRIEIVEADTGQRAVEALMTGRIDVGFVNVQLPGVAGGEAVALARSQGMRPVIVLMSDLVVPRWVELSVELDAYEFLKKPFDPEHVVGLLHSIQRLREQTRLLLVEDSQTARTLVRRVLGGTRFRLQIDETDSGRHALKMMQLKAYDVALIDFNMEGIDGLETACQARDAAPDTRLIMMSGLDSSNLAPAARHFGVEAFIKKPFYVRDVEDALHKTFAMRRPYLLNAVMTQAPPRRASA